MDLRPSKRLLNEYQPGHLSNNNREIHQATVLFQADSRLMPLLQVLLTSTLSPRHLPLNSRMIDNEAIQPLLFLDRRFHLFQLALVEFGTDTDTVTGFSVFGA